MCQFGEYLLRNPQDIIQDYIIEQIRRAVVLFPLTDDFRRLFVTYLFALGFGECTSAEKDLINSYVTGIFFY